MWLLLVAVGSGCLVRCWRYGIQQQQQHQQQQQQCEKRQEQQQQDDDRCPSEDKTQVFDSIPSPTSDDDDENGAMVEFREQMLKKKEKEKNMSLMELASARRASSKRMFDKEEDRASAKSVETSTTSTTFDPQTTIETPSIQPELDKASSVTVVTSGKRTIEFSKHTVHDGDLAGIEVKRKRESGELRVGQPQEQSLLSSFTCSFMDNLGLTDLWFAPRDGGTKVRKPKTPSRSRSRAVSRRTRCIPRHVSSLESCLNAQLHFDDENQFEEGRSGLGEVEALGRGSKLGAPFGIQKNYLPTMVRPSTRGDPSQEALLFSFGVGIGVMHMVTSNKAEIEKLRRCLKETEDLVQTLQRGEKPSTGVGSAQSGLTMEQQGNMAELEAQLEAELELMQLNSTEDELDAEVVHNELNASGLPGASDLEDDDKNRSQGNAANWAVSPRELDRRLRMLIETRQEERIAQLEEQLEHAESQLRDREMELQVWKDRVLCLTEISLSSGDKENSAHRNTQFRDTEDTCDLSKPGEQSPTDDICDEFLKSVFIGNRDNLESSCSISECGESWQRNASGTTPENCLSGGGMDNEPAISQLNRSSSTDLEQETKLTPLWSYGSFGVSHAGSTTPIEDVRSPKLFNTPRALRGRNGVLVMDKIRYWENIARKGGAPRTPEEETSAQPRNDQSSPLRFLSCSEEEEEEGGGSSRDDSSASDAEGGAGHVLIKRIVEKSKRGPTILKDVERMLAALDSE